ncbi:uncharacterized protein [Blastocystis hominis]|uniref:Snurportin-1 n=1 Tax=Blastocystis hominis TaxID=12968 RepID=D8M0S5_BLAHO|nr:uncharacterized protein [Blastocystis hominis]CBK21664.2 unnamed protein product [Blastocystis hominis]|eukprot:XP_012895712.1 uncharacterized protein [Blastocystis hominis]
MSLPIKSKSFSMLQEKRRKLQLDMAKQRRDQLISKKREQLLWESLSAGQKGSFPQIQQKDKRKEEAVRDQNRRRQFCQTLCIPEWMVEVPNDLARNWIVMPRPEGHRYLVSCKRGKASIRSLSGYTKNIKTNLPGGQMNFSGNCILDVIIADTCVYAMDILVFNSTEYSESEAESRLFTLHSRLSEESYYLILDKKQLPIIIVPYFECSVENLSSLHANTLHVPLNGLLFLDRFGKMEEGCTPLQLLWKDAQTATYVINTDAQGAILANQSVTLLYKDRSLRSLEGFVVVEGELPSFDDDSLLRCTVGGVRADSERQQWQLVDVNVVGYASYSKTLPDS